jgi:hypothetical protein
MCVVADANIATVFSQMLLALVYPIVLGLDRIETASFLRANGTFQYLTGLPSFPDPQTLRRFECCKNSFTGPSAVHASSSTWTAQWSPCSESRTVMRSVTTQGTEASAATTRCYV